MYFFFLFVLSFLQLLLPLCVRSITDRRRKKKEGKKEKTSHRERCIQGPGLGTWRPFFSSSQQQQGKDTTEWNKKKKGKQSRLQMLFEFREEADERMRHRQRRIKKWHLIGCWHSKSSRQMETAELRICLNHWQHNRKEERRRRKERTSCVLFLSIKVECVCVCKYTSSVIRTVNKAVPALAIVFSCRESFKLHAINLLAITK